MAGAYTSSGSNQGTGQDPRLRVILEAQTQNLQAGLRSASRELQSTQQSFEDFSGPLGDVSSSAGIAETALGALSGAVSLVGTAMVGVIPAALYATDVVARLNSGATDTANGLGNLKSGFIASGNAIKNFSFDMGKTRAALTAATVDMKTFGATALAAGKTIGLGFFKVLDTMYKLVPAFTAVQLGLDAIGITDSTKDMTLFQRAVHETEIGLLAISSSGLNAFSGMINKVNAVKLTFDLLRASVNYVADSAIEAVDAIESEINAIASNPFIEKAIEFQYFEAKLKTLTHSAEEGEKALKGLVDFAKTAPFELADIVDADIQLRVFNQDAEGLRDTMANLAIVSGRSLSDTATAIGKALSGLPEGLQILQESFHVTKRDLIGAGASLDKFGKIVSETKIQSLALKAALEKVVASNFGDVLTNKMDSLATAISSALDKLSLFKAQVGEAIAPIAKLSVDMSTRILDIANKGVPALKLIVSGFNNLRKAAAGAADSFLFAEHVAKPLAYTVATVTALASAMTALSVIGPVAITGIAGPAGFGALAVALGSVLTGAASLIFIISKLAGASTGSAVAISALTVGIVAGGLALKKFYGFMSSSITTLKSWVVIMQASTAASLARTNAELAQITTSRTLTEARVQYNAVLATGTAEEKAAALAKLEEAKAAAYKADVQLLEISLADKVAAGNLTQAESSSLLALAKLREAGATEAEILALEAELRAKGLLTVANLRGVVTEGALTGAKAVGTAATWALTSATTVLNGVMKLFPLAIVLSIAVGMGQMAYEYFNLAKLFEDSDTKFQNSIKAFHDLGDISGKTAKEVSEMGIGYEELGSIVDGLNQKHYELGLQILNDAGISTIAAKEFNASLESMGEASLQTTISIEEIDEKIDELAKTADKAGTTLGSFLNQRSISENLTTLFNAMKAGGFTAEFTAEQIITAAEKTEAALYDLHTEAGRSSFPDPIDYNKALQQQYKDTVKHEQDLEARLVKHNTGKSKLSTENLKRTEDDLARAKANREKTYNELSQAYEASVGREIELSRDKNEKLLAEGKASSTDQLKYELDLLQKKRAAEGDDSIYADRLDEEIRKTKNSLFLAELNQKRTLKELNLSYVADHQAALNTETDSLKNLLNLQTARANGESVFLSKQQLASLGYATQEQLEKKIGQRQKERHAAEIKDLLEKQALELSTTPLEQQDGKRLKNQEAIIQLTRQHHQEDNELDKGNFERKIAREDTIRQQRLETIQIVGAREQVELEKLTGYFEKSGDKVLLTRIRTLTQHQQKLALQTLETERKKFLSEDHDQGTKDRKAIEFAERLKTLKSQQNIFNRDQEISFNQTVFTIKEGLISKEQDLQRGVLDELKDQFERSGDSGLVKRIGEAEAAIARFDGERVRRERTIAIESATSASERIKVTKEQNLIVAAQDARDHVTQLNNLANIQKVKAEVARKDADFRLAEASERQAALVQSVQLGKFNGSRKDRDLAQSKAEKQIQLDIFRAKFDALKADEKSATAGKTGLELIRTKKDFQFKINALQRESLGTLDEITKRLSANNRELDRTLKRYERIKGELDSILDRQDELVEKQKTEGLTAEENDELRESYGKIKDLERKERRAKARADDAQKRAQSANEATLNAEKETAQRESDIKAIKEANPKADAAEVRLEYQKLVAQRGKDAVELRVFRAEQLKKDPRQTDADIISAFTSAKQEEAKSGKRTELFNKLREQFADASTAQLQALVNKTIAEKPEAFALSEAEITAIKNKASATAAGAKPKGAEKGPIEAGQADKSRAFSNKKEEPVKEPVDLILERLVSIEKVLNDQLKVGQDLNGNPSDSNTLPFPNQGPKAPPKPKPKPTTYAFSAPIRGYDSDRTPGVASA